MSTSAHASLLTLTSALVIKDLPKAKLQQNYDDGSHRKAEVPQSDGTNFEGLLYTLHEFKDAAAALEFTTGEEKFTNLRLCLYGNAKIEWDLVTEGKARTVPIYRECVRDLVRLNMSLDTKQMIVDYLNTVTKPRDISVRAFIRRLQLINTYLKSLPDHEGANPVVALTDDQIKINVHRAMPKVWKKEFAASNLHVTKVSLQELEAYMAAAGTRSDENNNNRNITPDKNSNGKRNHQGNGRNNNHGDGWFNNKKRKGGNGQANHGRAKGNGNGKQTKINPNIDCPLHEGAGHTWAECHQNQYGSNFRPRGSASGRGGRHGRGPGNPNAGRGASISINGNRGGGYTGPTHQTFFNDDINTIHGPTLMQQSPDVVGWTQTNGPYRGWNTPRSPGPDANRE